MYGTISLIASMDVKGVFVSELMFILMMEMGDSKQLEPLLYWRERPQTQRLLGNMVQYI